jgi:exopolyphosphatase / guanosine-5'-triphosphate,3'-diphosphate pyrophosphatase
MPLSAAIDVGSNTIRLLIGNCRDGTINLVVYERRITRLAEGITRSRILRDERIEASVAVLKEFSSLIKRNGVKTVSAVATSALREAFNSKVFIEKVLAYTGISINVISGEKEAELTLKGVLSSFPESVLSMCDSLLIIDIGGGSTEWILCRGENPAGMGSIPIGVINLLENCIKTDPVSETDISALNREILPAVEIFKKDIGNQLEKKACFVGTAGTFSTLASLDSHLKTYSRVKIHLHRIPLHRLFDIRNRLVALPVKERMNVAGLEPGRADLIIPGIQFTISLMENFAFDELIVSDYGLLEGVFLESLKEGDEKDIPEACKS